jgi:thiol-disulfide isomerase/thioredoxin
MGMDKVFVMMADRYYCRTNPETGKSYAYWMPKEKLEDLCKDNVIKKNLVQGVVPPNVILRDTTDKNWRGFYDLKSEYTILYFWDPECGHCKKITPKLQKLYAEKLKARNVEVFAVGKATGDDFEKWKKFIRDNKLSFINVGLTKTLYEEAVQDARPLLKYTNIESLNYHDTYDLYATPRIIVLDKDKKIIAKQLTISQLEDLMDRLQNIKDAPILFPPDPEEEAH